MIRTLFLSLILLASVTFAEEKKSPQVFLMLETNNIFFDRVAGANSQEANEYSIELAKLGYIVQPFEYTINKEETALYNFYKTQTSSSKIIFEEKDGNLKVAEMIVIRPAFKEFLEKLSKLSLPVRILLCSKNSDRKTQNLFEQIQLDVSNKGFKEIVDFVPRKVFKTIVRSESGQKSSGKSAWYLRKNYIGKFGRIGDDDFVILIDQLPIQNFIYSNLKKDLNIKILPFYSGKDKIISLDQDRVDLESVLHQIKEFIGEKRKK